MNIKKSKNSVYQTFLILVLLKLRVPLIRGLFMFDMLLLPAIPPSRENILNLNYYSSLPNPRLTGNDVFCSKGFYRSLYVFYLFLAFIYYFSFNSSKIYSISSNFLLI